MKFERLGNIAEIKTGKFDVNHSTEDGNYPFYTCAMGQFKSPTFSFDGEAIILPGNGANVGQVFFNKTGRFEAYQRTYVIQNISANIEFVFYYFKAFWKDSLKNSQYGSATNYIRLNNISDFKIPLPPLPEQIRIANILSKAENLIAQRKESLRLLDEFLKSTFLEMFGDPVRNEKGWEIVKIEDISTAIKDGPHISPEYSNDGIPILSTRNIRPGQLLLSEVKYVTEKTFNALTRYFKPQVGDVLLTKGGTTGFAKVVDFDFPFCVWVHIAIIRPKNNISSLYLENFLNSEFGYFQSQKYTRGIANRDLGLTRIAKIKLPLPPLSLQTQFGDIVKKTEVLKERYQASLAELENLYQSLSQRAFRGELGVKENPVSIPAEPGVGYGATLNEIKSE